MKIFIIIFLLASLNGCEKFFYGEYEIFEKYSNDKYYKKNIYIVKKGDNLYFISKKFSISIEEIIKKNNIKSPFKIFPNQKLIIPKKTIYTVLRGDTLYSISRRFNVDKYNLSKLNKLKTNNIIYVGQRLIIPNYKTIKKSKVNLTIDKIPKRKKTKFKQSKDKTKLIGELINLKRTLMNLNFQKSGGQLEKTSNIRKTKKEIARIKLKIHKLVN